MFQIPLQVAQDDKINRIYRNIEEKCQRYTKIFCFYIVINQCQFVSSIVFSIFDMLNGNLDTSEWSLPFDMIAPFDTSVIWKWYILWFIQFNIGFAYVSGITLITTYFVCCCLYIGAICEHSEHLFESIAEEVQQVLPRIERTHRLREIFCKIADTQATVFR